jgi:hypothetical protein
MDQKALVSSDIDLGWDLLVAIREVKPFIEIRDAFWATVGDSTQRYFYLVSDLVEQQGGGELYKVVHEAFHRNPRLRGLVESPDLGARGIDPFSIKVVGPREPIAIAVEHIQEKYSPKNQVIALREFMDKNIYINEIYIYPRCLISSLVS